MHVFFVVQRTKTDRANIMTRGPRAAGEWTSRIPGEIARRQVGDEAAARPERTAQKSTGPPPRRLFGSLTVAGTTTAPPKHRWARSRFSGRRRPASATRAWRTNCAVALVSRPVIRCRRRALRHVAARTYYRRRVRWPLL